MLTKKHFKALAEILGKTLKEHPGFYEDFLLDELCVFLKRENPAFSSEKFRDYIWKVRYK